MNRREASQETGESPKKEEKRQYREGEEKRQRQATELEAFENSSTANLANTNHVAEHDEPAAASDSSTAVALNASDPSTSCDDQAIHSIRSNPSSVVSNTSAQILALSATTAAQNVNAPGLAGATTPAVVVAHSSAAVEAHSSAVAIALTAAVAVEAHSSAAIAATTAAITTPLSNRLVIDPEFKIDSKQLTLEEKVLGVGGYGVVKKGCYRNLIVAAKQIKIKPGAELTSQEEFQYEVYRLSALEHQNIVRFYGICEKENKHFMIMELCDGGSLDVKYVTAAAANFPNHPHAMLLEVAFDIAKGLVYLHSQGIIHLDLKPGNILVDVNGRIKLADLGFAYADALLERKETPNAPGGSQWGTLPWAAPERLRGEKNTSAVDIYAFGLILCYLLNGKMPKSSSKALKKTCEVMMQDDQFNAVINSFNISQDQLTSFVEVFVLNCCVDDKIWDQVRKFVKNEWREYIRKLVEANYEGWRKEIRGLLEANYEEEEIPGNCPPAFAELILSCLQYDPTGRPTAIQVVERLEAIAQIYHPTPEALCIRLRTEDLVYQKHRELEEYQPSYAVPYNVRENWDEFWRKVEDTETKVASEGKKDREGKEEKKAVSANLDASQLSGYGFHQALATYSSSLNSSRAAPNTSTSCSSQQQYSQSSVSALFSQIISSVSSQIAELPKIGLNMDANRNSLARELPLPAVPSVYWLDDKFISFLNSNTTSRLLLVYGDAGTGKTLSVYQLARTLLEILQQPANGARAIAASNRPSTQSWIPIIIRPGILDWSNTGIENGIEIVLKNNYRFNFLGANSYSMQDTRILEHLKQMKLVFIFDGYDELVQNAPRRNIAAILGLNAWPNAKLIVSSRRNVVSDFVEPSVFNVDYKANAPQYEKLYVLPFSTSQILHFANKRLKNSNTPDAKFHELGDLRKVLHNPFVLNLFLQIYPSLASLPQADLNNLTRYAIYERFVEFWLKKNKNQLTEEVQDKLTQESKSLVASYNDYAAKIAFQLFCQKLSTGRVEDEEDLGNWGKITALIEKNAVENYERRKKEAKETQAKPISIQYEDYLRLMKIKYANLERCMPLQVRSNGYSYMHKSFYEYYILRRILNAMRQEMQLEAKEVESKEKKEEKQPVNKMLQSILNYRYLQEEPAVFEFMQEYWKEVARTEQEQVQEQMLGVIISTRSQPDSDEVVELLLPKLNPQLQDYKENLVMRKFIAELTGGVELLTEHWNIIGQYLNEDDFFFQLLLCNISQSYHFRNSLWKSINHSQEDAESSIAAANSITLLNVVGVDFNNLDLHGIKIPEADISGGQFDSANLEGADLTKVFAAGVSLRNCNLKRASLADIKFGQLPLIDFAKDHVEACCYSEDFRYFVVAASNDIYLYDGFTRKHICNFEGHTKIVTSVAFGPGGTLASGSWDHTVRLWDIERKKALHTFVEHNNKVTSIAFGPGGILASGSSDKTIRLWDVAQKKMLHAFVEHNNEVTSVAFGPGGILASGGTDKTIRLWDIYQKKIIHTFTEPVRVVTCVAFGPDGILASGSNDSSVRLWDVNQRKALSILVGHTNFVNCVAFGPNGILASGSWDRTVRLWDVNHRKVLNTFVQHVGSISSVCFGPGDILASGSYDASVRFWDINQRKALRTFVGHTDWVTSVNFGSDGILASGSLDSTVRLWDVNQRKIFHTFVGHKGYVQCVAFGPNGILASGSLDSTVRLWDSIHKKLLYTFVGHINSVGSVAFGPDGILASGSSDTTVRLWDINQKKALHIFVGHTYFVKSVAFGPDGILASGSWDNTVRLWDVNHRKALHTFVGHSDWVNSVAFGPSGILASGSNDKTIRFWDIYQKKELQTFMEHTRAVICVAFGPGGILASGSSDQTVRLWSLEQKSCLAVMKGFTDTVTSVSWLENKQGIFLATGGASNAVFVWKISRSINNVVNRLLYFSSQPAMLNLHGACIDGATGLSGEYRELFLQHNITAQQAAMYTLLALVRAYSILSSLDLFQLGVASPEVTTLTSVLNTVSSTASSTTAHVSANLSSFFSCSRSETLVGSGTDFVADKSAATVASGPTTSSGSPNSQTESELGYSAGACSSNAAL